MVAFAYERGLFSVRKQPSKTAKCHRIRKEIGGSMIIDLGRKLFFYGLCVVYVAVTVMAIYIAIIKL